MDTKDNTPVGIMYAPTCTIGGIIYVGGASDWIRVALRDRYHQLLQLQSSS